MTETKDVRLLVCVNPVGSNKPCCGGDRGSERLAAAIEVGIADRRIDARVDRIHCLNRCLRGPAMRIAPGGRFFLDVSDETVAEILDALESEAGTRPPDAAHDPFSGLDGAFPGG
jgi:(2Fe-2S) ferredoxin